jgi:hypothetical protein
LYRELQEISKGQEYLFGRYVKEKPKEKTTGWPCSSVFDPDLFTAWMRRQLARYFKEKYGWEKMRDHRKDPRYFRLHNFRTTAISKARERGVPPEKAKELFGVSPRVMELHYENVDRTAIADGAADDMDKPPLLKKQG